jgi:hypothetical protein
VTQRRLRWTVVGLVVLALLGAAVNFRLRNDIAHTEVWRTDRGTELRSGPGGDVLDEYALLVCADPSGKRVDYVARRRSRLYFWLGQSSLHRLNETGTVVEIGGERWRRFHVREAAITPEEIESDLNK